MKGISIVFGATCAVATVALAGCATTPREPEMQTCADGSVIAVTVPCPPPPPPPPPATQTCFDGSVVLATSPCPAPPPPPPPPPYRRSGERG